MKRLISTLALICVAGIAFAQHYVVIDSEKVFKSIAEYNSAMTQLDSLAKEYQSKVDAMYKEVENQYTTYAKQRSSITESERKNIEAQLAEKEKTAQQYQNSVFGSDGVMMKKRIELIRPIQEKVFSAIEKYAQQNGIDLVIDRATNASILYNAPSADHTEQIISILK